MKRILIVTCLGALAAACTTEAEPTTPANEPEVEVEIPSVEEAADQAGIDEANFDAELEALDQELDADSGN